MKNQKIPYEQQAFFSLALLRKAGDTIIGRSADKILASFRVSGCKEINTAELSLFKDYRIYANDELKVKNLLSIHEVANIFSEYNISMYVKQGILTLDLGTLSSLSIHPNFLEIFNNPELVKKHLSKMNVLVDNLNFIS